MLIDLEQLNTAEKRFNEELPLGKPVVSSLKNLPGDFIANEVIDLQQGSAIISKEENIAKRKEKIREASLEPFDFAFERSIGNNDSVQTSNYRTSDWR